MSNHVTSLLRRKRLGLDLTGKAIVLLMGDLASDDGSGVWASKATMAAELETTVRTIQRQIHNLIGAGFVEEVGTRRHRNGDTIEYRIIVETVEKCPDNRDRPPTHRRPSAQDVDGQTQDMTPDSVSPLTDCRPTPDTPSGEPPTHRRPNQSKPNGTNCAASPAHTQDFEFEKFLEEFTAVYPRNGDPDETAGELRKAIWGGANASDILSGAKAYAEEQAGNSRQYIAYSQNWVREKRWTQFEPEPQPQAQTCNDEVLNYWAETIKSICAGKEPHMRGRVSPGIAEKCVRAKLVTPDECQQAGVR